MALIRFLFYALAANILFIAMLIVMVGEVWLLRIVLIWFFDVDLAKEIDKWLKHISTK